MQGTLVRSLVREDPTCHGVNKPVLLILRSRVHVLQQEKRHSAKSLYTATRKQPPLARTGEGPAQPKINKYLKKKKNHRNTVPDSLLWSQICDHDMEQRPTRLSNSPQRSRTSFLRMHPKGKQEKNETAPFMRLTASTGQEKS